MSAYDHAVTVSQDPQTGSVTITLDQDAALNLLDLVNALDVATVKNLPGVVEDDIFHVTETYVALKNKMLKNVSAVY